jgi:hypothetical protein
VRSHVYIYIYILCVRARASAYIHTHVCVCVCIQSHAVGWGCDPSDRSVLMHRRQEQLHGANAKRLVMVGIAHRSQERVRAASALTLAFWVSDLGCKVYGLAFTPEARPLCSSSTEYRHKSTPPAARGHVSVWGEGRLGVEAGAIDQITPSPFHIHAAPTLHAHGKSS